MARVCSSVAVLLLATAVVNVVSGRATVAAPAPASGYVLASTFGDRGKLTFPTWTTVRDIAPLADGSALVQLDRHDRFGVLVQTGIAKVRADGTFDPSFAPAASTPGISETGAMGGALTAMSDGAFFIGSRLYRVDGTVDTSYGVNGYVGVNGSMFANDPTSIIEVGGRRITMVSNASAFNDCYIFPIDASGSVGPLVQTGVLCTEAIPLSMPDGSTLVVLHEISTGYHLIRLTASGALDTSFGSSGVVTVDPAIGPTPRLIDAALTPDGGILLLPQSYSRSSGAIVRIHLNGRLDVGFGSSGAVPFSGQAQSVTVDQASAPLLGVGYTFALHPSTPYHPALLQLTSTGQVNGQFNPSGIRPGWLDMTELGIAEPAGGGPQAQFGSGRLLVGLNFGADGTTPQFAVLVELQPLSPTPISPAPPTPQAVTVPAVATAKAVRLGVVSAR